MSKKVYAVRRGRVPGIYAEWSLCSSQVAGFSGAEHKSFKSTSEAEAWLGEVFARAPLPAELRATQQPLPVGGAMIQVDPAPLPVRPPPATVVLPPRVIPALDHPVPEGHGVPALERIFCDGAMNRHTGDEAWGSVVDDDDRDLIEPYQSLLTDMPMRRADLPVGRRWVLISKFNDVVSQQNNGAELMALVAGMRIAVFTADRNPRKLHSDSRLLVDHWSQRLGAKKCASMDPRKAAYVHELMRLRARLEALGGQLLWISGDDNPADLGFHV